MFGISELDQLITTLVQSPAIAQVVIFFGIWLVLWLPFAIPLAIALKWRPSQPTTPNQKLPLVISLYSLAPFLVWGAAQIQNLPIRVYGLASPRTLLPSFGIGLGLSALGILLLVMVQWRWGWLTLRSPQPETALTEKDPTNPVEPPSLRSIVLPILLLASIIGLVEEGIFRGFILTQLQLSYPGWAAAIGSSLIFAVLHLVWEGRSQIPQLPGLWLMGMVLVLARWVDGGNIGIAWGLHTGWVWGIASLDTAQVFTRTGQGPGWLLGAPGLPLTSAMTLLLLGLTASTLWAFPH